MKKAIILLFAMIISINCEANNGLKSIPPHLKSGSDPIVFMQNFYKWYKTKYDYLDHGLYLVKTDLKKNTPYRIDFNAANKYLSVLKASGFFDDNYLNRFRDYLKAIDITLQKTKQTDGTVDGLDYDQIIHNQEPESILSDLSLIQLSIFKTTNQIVYIKSTSKYNINTYQLFSLVKVKDRYLIDDLHFINNN